MADDLPLSFSLTGCAAQGVTCKGEDAESGCSVVVRTHAPSGLPRELGEVASEIARRGAQFKQTDRELCFQHGLVSDRNIPVLYCYTKNAHQAPLVFANHGSTRDSVGQLFMGVPLAEAGFFTVLMDARFHGRRKTRDWCSRFTGTRYKESYLNLLLDTCDDISTLIDHLGSDPRVDVSRIGTTGISQGGFVSFMLITRDQRVSVAAPIIGSPDLEADFGEGLPLSEHPPTLQSLICKHSPLRHAESMPPTALLVQNGTDDELVPIAGTRKLDAILRPLYANMRERYRYIEYAGLGHTDRGMREPAIDWLVQHLRP